MPSLRLYREHDGTAPLIEWLDRLPVTARWKCLARLTLLAELGCELAGPHTDYLSNGIYELRATDRGVRFCMLYFFHETVAVVVSHGLMTDGDVPAFEIQRAVRRRWTFARDPERHTFVEPTP